MGDTYTKFTVAAVQAASVFFDRDKTLDKAIRFIDEAADRGAVIIGFPELFISGHPCLWYDAKKSNPLSVQQELFKQLVKNSVKIPSPETDRLCAAAARAHSYIVIGISEVDSLFPGTLYNSQLFISNTGAILGVHRKMVVTYIEKLIYSGGDGSYMNVYDTQYGKLSAMVCGEHAHSLYKYALLAMGAQIHVAGWPSFTDHVYDQVLRDSIDFRVRDFAHEGKIFVINSCGFTDDQNIAICCTTQDEKTNVTVGGGGSSIIGPSGEYLAGPMYGGEGVVTAEISLEDCLPGKQYHNVLGHYTRWDVLSLDFNRKKLSPFKDISSPDSGVTELFSEVREIKKDLGQIREKLDRLTKDDHTV